DDLELAVAPGVGADVLPVVGTPRARLQAYAEKSNSFQTFRDRRGEVLPVVDHADEHDDDAGGTGGGEKRRQAGGENISVVETRGAGDLRAGAFGVEEVVLHVDNDHGGAARCEFFGKRGHV